MKTRDFQSGQALILIVFGIIGLVMITGLAVDGVNTYADRQNAQTAADAAALSAALRMAKDKGDWSDQAFNTAQTNGFPNNVGGTVVKVNSPPVDTDRCNGSAGPYDGDINYVQVVIRTEVDTYLARVLGMKETHNCVEAIAHGQPAVENSSAMFGGAGIVATKTEGQAFILNSSSEVTTKNSGIFINSNASNALELNSSSHLEMDYNARIVGTPGYSAKGSSTWSPGITSGVPQLSMPLPEWSSIPAIPAPPTCSGSSSDLNVNSSQTVTVSPNADGTKIFNYVNVGSSGTLNLNPGTYCVNGDFNVNSSSEVNAPSGRITLVFTNGSLNVGSSSDFVASDIEIFSTNGNVQVSSSVKFIAPRLRFYSSGSGHFGADSSSTVTSGNAYIYLAGGNVQWNSSANLNLSAPPVGDPYAGLLVYMPWSNTSSVNFNSSSDINLKGTFLAPHAPITLNSSSGVKVQHSQIVGYTIVVNSSSELTVEYNPEENYGSPQTDPAIVELVK